MIKNVVIVNDFNYVQGGASKVAIDTANMLAEKFNNLNIYFFSGDHIESEILNNKIIQIYTNQGESLKDKNRIRGIINGLYNFKARKKLKKLLKTLNNEETIIHVHGWTKSLSCSVFDIVFRKKYKMILTLHDYFTACPNGGYFNYKQNSICKYKPCSLKCTKCNCDSRNYCFKLYRILRQFIQNKIVKLNFKLTDVITISDFSENILSKTLNPNTKIHRVYNPIDFFQNKEKVDYTVNDYFLYVGRVSKEKGVDLFCEAVTRASVNGIVVGDGQEKEHLSNKYLNIKFVGWQDSQMVGKFMKNAKALVFTSRWYETMGLTVLEALQYNVPVIVSSNTAAVEFISQNGLIFKNGEVDDLVKKIKIINTGKKFVFKNNYDFLSSENYINKLIEVYKEV